MLTSVKQVNKENDLKLTAYPNPTSDKLSIEMPINGRDDLNIEIYNYQGQMLQTEKLSVAGVQRR